MNGSAELRVLLLGAAAGGLFGACGPEHSARRATSSAAGPLDQGDVARVGDVPLTEGLVRGVALRQHLVAPEALRELEADALWARAPLDTSTRARVRWQETATLARRVVDEVSASARAAGPPEANELKTLQVTHAVVVRAAQAPDAAAMRLADALRDFEERATSSGDFQRRAASLPNGASRVVTEQLGPFAADGVLESGGTLDPDFVAASFGLRAPGEVSSVVETRFGWHVIRLDTQTAVASADEAERRLRLAPAVMRLRVRSALLDVLAASRRRSGVEISAAAENLMASAVSTTP